MDYKTVYACLSAPTIIAPTVANMSWHFQQDAVLNENPVLRGKSSPEPPHSAVEVELYPLNIIATIVLVRRVVTTCKKPSGCDLVTVPPRRRD